MSRLIKVGTFNGADVFANPKYIQGICSTADKDGSIIVLHRGEVLYVNEPPHDVAYQVRFVE